MSNGMMMFNSDEFGNVRVVEKGGDNWFVAKDICDCVGLEVRDSVRYLDDDEKCYVSREHIGLPPGKDIVLINESGLYSLILRSRKPEAKKFKKWVTSEVLPSIRKHGTYMTDSVIDQVMANPAIVYKMAETMLQERNLREIAEAKIRADEPKVKRSEAVMDLPDTISIGTMAAILKQKGLNMGQNKLFKALREHKFLLSQHDRYNHPAQKWINEGLFKLEEVIDERCGCVRYKTKVTGKGQVYLVDYFCSVQ